MNPKIALKCVLLTALGLLSGCMHYHEESGRKTEYNGETGRFESGDYASGGFTTASQSRSKAVSEKELKRSESK